MDGWSYALLVGGLLVWIFSFYTELDRFLWRSYLSVIHKAVLRVWNLHQGHLQAASWQKSAGRSRSRSRGRAKRIKFDPVSFDSYLTFWVPNLEKNLENPSIFSNSDGSKLSGKLNSDGPQAADSERLRRILRKMAQSLCKAGAKWLWSSCTVVALA